MNALQHFSLSTYNHILLDTPEVSVINHRVFHNTPDYKFSSHPPSQNLTTNRHSIHCASYLGAATKNYYCYLQSNTTSANVQKQFSPPKSTAKTQTHSLLTQGVKVNYQPQHFTTYYQKSDVPNYTSHLSLLPQSLCSHRQSTKLSR